MRLREAYEILGVSHNADIGEVKSAYRKKVLQVHPDKGGSAHEFIRVQAAYEIICEFLNSDSGEAPIDVPDELREIIDELVRSFREQYLRSEAICAATLGRFSQDMRDYLNRASRRELRDFGTHFRTHWNQTITHLFQHFNDECVRLISKYDSWFDKTMEETFAEIHRAELRNFARNHRFWAYGLGLLGLGIVLARSSRYAYTSASWLVTVVPVVALLPLVYWADCLVRRKSPKDVETFDVQPFRVDRTVDFQGSIALKQGAANTASLVAAGSQVGAYQGLMKARKTGGDWDPAGLLFGAAVGLAVGEVIDRLINPTAKIRAVLKQEYEQLMAVAQPQITQHIVDRNHALMNDIKEKIEQNYESRMRETVRLLADR
jgi:hypothetical protein